MSEPADVIAGPLSKTEIKSFHANGFLVAREIADTASVQVIRARITQLFAEQAGRREGTFFDLTGSDEDNKEMGLPQLLDVRSYAPELIETVFFANASRLAVQLLGANAKFVADHALVKPAHHGAVTPWHQDDAFREGIYKHNEISIWLALQETDDTNGCLGFIPGSHRFPVLPHRSFNGNIKAHALECVSGWPRDKAVYCPLHAGDCTVHSNLTLHGAGPNTSPHARYAYVLVFGTPPERMSAPYNYAWLAEKCETRLERRRNWLRRGGLLVHGWRRIRQVNQIGLREFTRRLFSRLR
jgi:ectoine hydroxylase-related dioxygenase (phytanoyl-CoA dioxygenase family)